MGAVLLGEPDPDHGRGSTSGPSAGSPPPTFRKGPCPMPTKQPNARRLPLALYKDLCLGFLPGTLVISLGSREGPLHTLWVPYGSKGSKTAMVQAGAPGGAGRLASHSRGSKVRKEVLSENHRTLRMSKGEASAYHTSIRHLWSSPGLSNTDDNEGKHCLSALYMYQLT